MRLLRGCVAALAVIAAVLGPAKAEPSRVERIRERLSHANLWRDHVMVAAHRGGGLAQSRTLYPENSLASLEGAIRAGAEIVEIDIQKSSDGAYVVFHDSYLDRTSTCKGRLAERTLAELKACRLVVEGTGAASAEGVPALSEVLDAARGRILVNIDNKLAPEELAGIVGLARGMGMAGQLIVKQNLWNAERVAAMRQLMAAIGPGVLFMPIVADDAVRDPRFPEAVARAFSAPAVELIHWRSETDAAPTGDGGPLFSMRARAAAVRGNFHLWVDTYGIVNKAGGWLAGGRGDDLAVDGGIPAACFGFWAERGATVIQTDEPELAVRWLGENGYRVPYGGEAPAAAVSSGAHAGLLATN